MYGLLLEGIYYYIRTIFGEDTLREVRAKANVNHGNFSTHQVKLLFTTTHNIDLNHIL